MKRILAGLMIAFGLGACAPQTRLLIAGFDGRPVDPVSQEQATTECSAKAQVASAGVPHQLFGDTYGIGRAIEQAGVQRNAFIACMAEKGMRVTWVPVDAPSAAQTASISK